MKGFKLKEAELLKLIKEHNFEGVRNHLNTRGSEALLSEEAIKLAFREFLESDPKTMTNSQNIIGLLYDYAFDKKRKANYLASPKKLMLELFELHERTLHHSSPKGASIVRQKTADDYSKKMLVFEERQTLRGVYKKLDDGLERDLVWKIRYPEGTSFIRKWLKIPPDRAANDIEKDFMAMLPSFMKEMRKAIESDTQFRDANGKFLLSEQELSMVIYERLSLKATTQLGLRQNKVDGILREVNTALVKESISKVKAMGDDLENNIKDLRSKINGLIPPHLLEYKGLDLKGDEFGSEINKQTAMYGKDFVYKQYLEFVGVFTDHLRALEQQVVEYKNKPGREWTEASSLKEIMNIRAKFKDYYGFQQALIERGAISIPKEITSFEQDITIYLAPGMTIPGAIEDKLTVLIKSKEISEHINIKDIGNKIFSYIKNELINKDKELHKAFYVKLMEHHNKSKPKDQLTEFERLGIQFTMDPTSVTTREDKELLVKFYEYALGNAEFNTRLGNILKTDEELVKLGTTVSILHKFTYRSKDYESLSKLLDKFENLINKAKYDDLQESERITLAELSKIDKFLGATHTIAFFKWLPDIFKDSAEIQGFVALYDRANNLAMEFKQKIEQQYPHEEGDITMDIASRYREFTRHAGGFKEWVQDQITPYSHAAITMKTAGGIAALSHVTGIYESGTSSVATYVISESFRVYPGRLIQNTIIRKKLWEVLELEEGNLENKLHEMYSNIAKNLHDPAYFKEEKLKNDQGKRFMAGASRFIPGGRRVEKPVREWAKEVLEDKANIGHKIKDPSGEGFIICSEFAAKMTVLALVELEEELIEKIKVKDPTFEPPKGGLLKMPFHEFEDLGRVDPARLVRKLSEAGAIEKVPEADIIKNGVKTR